MATNKKISKPVASKLKSNPALKQKAEIAVKTTANSKSKIQAPAEAEEAYGSRA